MSKIIIVIPTYNERDNIEKIISKILGLNNPNISILVVDDNSPDGTGQIVENIKKENAEVSILHRDKKEGLGKAYIAGFKKALSDGADLIFEMDADLSHDPKYIPAMLEASEENDLVLGSRYVKGGGVSNWNFIRRQISRFGNIYARVVLGLPYKDLTGGFKCYRRKVLETIDLDAVNSLGYNFQIETTYEAHRAGFRITEVPIVFVERVEGKSKFNLKIMLEGFLKVLTLRFKKHK